jgi:diacylglycerol kinase (ATP)
LRKATLIYNPTAGWRQSRYKERLQQAVEVLSKAGIKAEIARTSGTGSAHWLASKAVDEGSELILVCGGDGTINDVVNALAGGRIPLGILPGGTANIAAKELGLPEDPIRAAQQFSDWQSKPVALGRATWSEGGKEQRRYFLSVAGVGFDAHVIRKLPLLAKAKLGWLAYFFEAIKQAFHYRYPQFACHADGVETNATLAVAQRSRFYAGWLHVAPGPGLLNPTLASCMFLGSGPGSYVAYGFAVLLGQHMHLPDVKLAASQQMACRPNKPGSVIYFELDGELVGRLPATFDVVPDALTLMGPWSKLKT